jgi:transglutaminase-like putative cysteine protease
VRFLAALLLLIPAATVAADQHEAVRRNVRFTLVVENPSGDPARGKKVWLYGPLPRSSTQPSLSLQRLDIETPHVTHQDPAGNTVVELGPLDFAPYQSRVISIAANLVVGDEPQPPPSKNLHAAADLVEPQPFIEATDPGIASLAASLRGADAAASARAIYDWVRTNLTYAGYIADELGARYALEHRRGDCTEYADLSAALARALGIPARVIGGYVVESDAVLRGRDYHNWTEVWLGDRWLILDAQKQRFDEHADQYIAFHIVAPKSSGPMNGAERFRADDGLVVRWN